MCRVDGGSCWGPTGRGEDTHLWPVTGCSLASSCCGPGLQREVQGRVASKSCRLKLRCDGTSVGFPGPFEALPPCGWQLPFPFGTRSFLSAGVL